MEDGIYYIGRSAGSGRGRKGHLVIDNPTVSERHAELVVLGDTYYLTDLGSHNGTWHRVRGRLQRFTDGYVAADEPLQFGVVECTLTDLINGRELAEA